MQSYTLRGGVDQHVGKAQANPGTLQDCLNYEVSDRAGYTRIKGISRYDGQFHLDDLCYRSLTGSLMSGSFLAGDKVNMSITHDFVGVVIDARLDGSKMNLCLVTLSDIKIRKLSTPFPQPGIPFDLNNLTRPGMARIDTLEAITRPQWSQANVNLARKHLVRHERENIGPVPGNPAMPVAGMFWYKNRLYAIRDFPMVWFTSMNSYTFRVGHQVTMPGGVFEVLELHYISDNYTDGYMVVWPIDQNGNIMTILPEPGDIITRPSSYTAFDTGGAAFGELPIGTQGIVSFGDGKAVVTGEKGMIVRKNDELSLCGYCTPAGMWKATRNGWAPVDLKREAQFNHGTSAFQTFLENNVGIAASAQESPDQAGRMALFNGRDVTTDIQASHGTTVALSGGASDELHVTGFDFSAIPDRAMIDGIQVTITRQADVGAKCHDFICELIGTSGASYNKAQSASWESLLTACVYGGPSDTWGNDNITPKILHGTGFGVRLVTRATDTIPSGTIDAVSIKVTYRRRDARVFVWTGVHDVPINLVNAQLINGSYADGDGSGWLVLDIPDADNSRQISNGMALHTAAGGGGEHLADISSASRHIRLPGWEDLKANRSQYRFVSTNFYGMDDYRSIYGVSGASPAFTYDGTHLLWIRTTLAPADDLPRHVARHGAALVLGYHHGAYILSVLGQPTNFRGVDGAVSKEIGQRITNLLPAMGDAMIITSDRQTMALYGLVPDDYQQKTISSNRGAIEYTSADVGSLLVCDVQGIAAAESADAFGSIERKYKSGKIQQWLHQRLLPDNAFERPSVVGVLSVSHKNQYRMYFHDGTVMTMTANDTPAFTFQRYFDTSVDHGEGWPIACLANGIDDDGHERIFGTFDTLSRRGYVFDLDSGDSFDGMNINAWLEFNPLSFSRPTLLKRFGVIFFHGMAEGFARLSVSRNVDDDPPDRANGFSFHFGDVTKPVTGTTDHTGQVPVRGSVDAPIEGYEMTVRVDSQTDSEGTHTIQTISTDADSRGDSRGHVRG